jgi:uncharacterized protein YjbI with pentapeptide repeats
MQVEGHLRGDETLTCEHLHPEHAQYEARLPGTRVRCFLREKTTDGSEPRFYEVPMVLDTLWVDMHAEQLVLVWRGSTRAESEEFEEKTELFVMEERLAEVPASLDQCQALFLETLAEMEREAEPESAESDSQPEVGVEDSPQDGVAPVEASDAEEISREELDRQVDALLARAGVDPQGLPPEARSRMRADQDRVFAKLSDPDGVPSLEEAALEGRLSASMSELGLDLNDLPPVSDRAMREQLRLVEELGAEDGAALLQDPSAARLLSALAAVLPTAGIDPEHLDPLIAEARKLRVRLDADAPEGGEASALAAEPGSGESEDGDERAWTRERVAEAGSQNESLAGQDLSGLDLSGLELQGADLSEADLSGARLRDAQLDGALLAGANLRGADLSGASLRRVNAAGGDLSEARLAGACLIEADLQEAKLSDAVLEGASLEDVLLPQARLLRADLRSAEGAGGNFAEADLSEARLSNGRFPGADFSNCVLAGTHFEDADLSDASFHGASCPNARFDGADLSGLRASDGGDFSGCSFVRAQGLESIWMESDLSGADFSYARMQGANFIKAGLEGANLRAADMRGSRFIRARLGRARLVQMNLFEGSLEKADLRQADLTGSNLYGVEFLDAVLAGARLEGANLRMTKLG